MAKRSTEKPEMVVAGPGAGKTHAMVRRIAEKLVDLLPARHLAAITFTNAATSDIHERLHQLVSPTPNVFVGTIHAFLNRFVVLPFARPFSLLPEDRTFVGINTHELVNSLESRRTHPFAPQHRNAARTRIVESLLRRGVVPYDEIINLACKLLEDKTVRARVSRRLQFLFVDEFQDIDNRHLRIFDHLRKAGQTRIFVVGDPEQFVYGFTYGQRSRRHPGFPTIPFFQFRSQARTTSESTNRRSCAEIVAFTNHFHGELQQVSSVGSRSESRVLFLEDMELDHLVVRFRARSEEVLHQHGSRRRLYLARENSAFDSVRQQFSIGTVSNDSTSRTTPLQEALDLLALCRRESQRTACSSLSIGSHEWRKLGMALVRDVRDARVSTVEHLRDQWFSALRIPDMPDHRETISAALEHFRVRMFRDTTLLSDDGTASIHRAKGLEATAVLVLAASLVELNKWLTTDRALRDADKRDDCRLGYVAFSRAKELLCIGCRQALDEATRRRLEYLGVTLVPATRNRSPLPSGQLNMFKGLT
ncbi:MAG: UvrD-helicase domain-containing protein [Polyangiaceae bacterium]